MKVTLDLTVWELEAVIRGVLGPDAAAQAGEQFPLHNCARCGAEFRLQVGRSTGARPHRVGLLYCSHSCARAAAQKAYRQRKREAAS